MRRQNSCFPLPQRQHSSLFHEAGQKEGDLRKCCEERRGEQHEKEERQGGLGDPEDVVVVEAADDKEIESQRDKGDKGDRLLFGPGQDQEELDASLKTDILE
jgi:hypothetical protein